MYHIIIDSCGELSDEMKKDAHFSSVPLTLMVDDYEIIDDETFDQADFLQRVSKSTKPPKSACPSPEAYLTQMRCDADHIYVITLSSQLSGSFNSACLARNLLLEEEPDKRIHIVDSKSASIGQSLIGLKIAELEEAGLSFEEVCEETDAYIESQHTFFVLESLDTLEKAGRLSHLKAKIASTLKIKPIMGSTEIGSIQQLDQTRGMNKAIERMVAKMMEVTSGCENKVLAISHCNCLERAMKLKEIVEKTAHFKKVLVVDTAGVSSMYANDGGLIMVV